MQTKIFWISLISLVLLLACDAGKRDLQKAEEQNTITAYEEFLKKHPQHELADSARSRLEELYWDQAQFKNTIPAYEKFLENYPKSRFYEKAHVAIENLYSQRHKAFSNVRSVKLIIQDSYENTVNRYAFRPLVSALFQNFAGLQIVGTEAKAYDAIFRLESKYRPLSGLYTISIGHSETLWTGASLKGKISLEIPGVMNFEQSFDARHAPEPSVSGRDSSAIISLHDDPEDAPFCSLFMGVVLRRIVEMLGKAFGPSFFVSLVTEPKYHIIYGGTKPCLEETSVRGYARDNITEVKDPIAVDSLVKTLYDDGGEWWSALLVLKKIQDPRTIEPLLDAALADIAYSAKKEALDILYEIGDARVVGPLITSFGNTRILLEEKVEVLEKITGEKFGKSPMTWQEWWEQNKDKYP